MGANLNAESGKRGNWRYIYGTHAWFPFKQVDFSRGMIRDLAKTDIPENGLYDIGDFLVHREGHLIKRGGTEYAGHALGGSAAFATGVFYAEFQDGPQLLAVSDLADDDGHLYQIETGSATDLGGVSGHSFKSIGNPKMFFGVGQEFVIFPQAEAGGAIPIIYDGTNPPHRMDDVSGSGADGMFCEIYKARIVVGGGKGGATTVNRAFFSPIPDPTVAWDTASFIDFDHPITGFASLQNALLVFSAGHTERLIGTTPPSVTDDGDMDRQPVGDIGCIDARSIAVYQNSAIIANTRGVYMTNGVGFRNLTAGPHGNDGIETYWQQTFMDGYDPASDVIAGGVIRDFYFVSSSITRATLVCHIPTGAWTQIWNVRPSMFGSATSINDELYYADSIVPRIVKLSQIFTDENSTNTGVDANGLNVLPYFETKSFGQGVSDVAWGDIHVTAMLQDVDPPGSPDMQVAYTPSLYSGTQVTPPESPFLPTANGDNSVKRKRFSSGIDVQSVSIFVSQENGPSAQTVIRSVEIDQRGYPQTTENP